MKKDTYTITVETSISNRRHFKTQREVAEFLGIVSSDRKSLDRRAKQFGYSIEYDK